MRKRGSINLRIEKHPVYLTSLIPRSIANDLIKLNTMEKYKTTLSQMFITHTRTHTKLSDFPDFFVTFHRHNEFYTLQTVFSILLH